MGRINNFLGGRQVKPAADGYDVFLIAGQSNALGAGLGEDLRLDRAHRQLHQYAGSGRRAGKILTGSHPLWHQTPSPGVGFGVTFGNLFVKETGRPTLLVPVARGESGFHPHNGYTWDPTDDSGAFNLYGFACEQLSAALATHANNTLRGVLWHQGETDTWYLNEDEYAAKLVAFVTRLRAKFGTVPFILGQMNPDRMDEGNSGYVGIDAAHQAAPARIPMTGFVHGTRDMFNSVQEKLHYNAAGQRELGRRYYAEYKRLQVT